MPNHTLCFCASIDGLTDDEMLWWVQVLDILQGKADGVLADDEPRYIERFFSEAPFVNFLYSFGPLKEMTKVTFWSTENGSPGQVGILVQEFLRIYRPLACWFLSWSETCSEMIDGQFSGGAVFVTSQLVHHIHASEWAAQMRDEYGRKSSVPFSPNG